MKLNLDNLHWKCVLLCFATCILYYIHKLNTSSKFAQNVSKVYTRNFVHYAHIPMCLPKYIPAITSCKCFLQLPSVITFAQLLPVNASALCWVCNTLHYFLRTVLSPTIRFLLCSNSVSVVLLQVFLESLQVFLSAHPTNVGICKL